MDQFTYGYGTTSNRLLNVADAAGITSNTDDIEPGQVANNYQYDLLGQLISDNQEGIVNYNWRLSDRKLRSITGASTKADVNFIYNPFGQRVVKIVKPKVNGVVDKQSNWIYTYYSYDANGQVMAVYDCKLDGTNATLNQATLKEQHLYGSQRLGMVNKNTLLYQSNTAYTTISPLVQNTYGNTNYELNNHLGNVNAVITDRRYWNTTTLKHEAGVEMKNDYYPFGMEMPLRQSGSNDYRYGYNGMELDNEVSGNGNSYTTEFRQYDPRLGRWKSLDPLMMKYPSMSPYVAFNNNPVFFVDPLGLEGTNPDNPKEIEEITVTAKREGKKIKELPSITVTAKRTFFQKYLKYPIKRIIKNIIAFGKRLDQKMKGNATQKDGLTIWGSSSSSKESTATKSKKKAKYTFDFQEFSENMSIYILGKTTKSEMSLDGEFDGTKLAEKTNDIKEIVEIGKEKKSNTTIKESDIINSNTHVVLRIMETDGYISEEKTKEFSNVNELQKWAKNKAFKVGEEWWLNIVKEN